MDIAYCILCHEMNIILEETLNILSKNNHIYIHIDKKTNLKNFKDFFENKNIKILENRVDVKWGHFTQVKAMLLLLEATRVKKYDYISILSGDDLPLKSNLEIDKFYKENQTKEFIGVQNNIILSKDGRTLDIRLDH